ncbi:unnamed protein product, partial [Hymenolepis diminuta]
MEGQRNLDFNYNENRNYFDTDELIDEIEELDARLNLPHSLRFTKDPLVQSLAADAWHLRTSKRSIFGKDPTPPDSSSFKNEAAMASQIELMEEFRQQAKRKIKRISVKERNRIIDSVRKFSLDELLRQHLRTASASRGECDPDTDSTTEMEDVQ